MASLTVSRYLTAIPFLVLYFRTLYAEFNVSFASEDIVDKGFNFESLFAFYGDAKFVSSTGRGMSVQLSGSAAPSAGRVVYKHPIKLGVEGNPRKQESFESKFGFSLSNEGVDGLAFLMAPTGFPVDEFGGSFGLPERSELKFLAVEFDASRDEKYGDLNGNHVGVDISSLVSVRVSNVSLINLTLNSAKKLQAWVDYQAISKRLEVRLGEFGESKPFDPLLSYPLDWSRMWGDTQVLISLSSASRNSSQKCNLYSWSWRRWSIPQWMHSEPLDPDSIVDNRKEYFPVRDDDQKQRDCTFRVLGALVLGVGCGALGALVVLFIWTLLGYKRPVVPEDYAEKSLDKFDYEKAKIIDKSSGKI